MFDLWRLKHNAYDHDLDMGMSTRFERLKDKYFSRLSPAQSMKWIPGSDSSVNKRGRIGYIKGLSDKRKSSVYTVDQDASNIRAVLWAGHVR